MARLSQVQVSRLSMHSFDKRQLALKERLRGDYVPESFEDMYSHYYEYVVRLVASFGIEQENAEDVAQSILMKFFEHDALSDFDTGYTTSYGGVTRRAVFRTFLSGFVKSYVRHFRERQAIMRVREGLSTETVMFVYSDTGHEATWIELHQPVIEDEHDELYEQDLVRSIRSRLATVAPRNAQDQCDLVAFFDAVQAQAQEEGRVDTAALAVEFGVSKTSIQNWMKRLRAEVSVVLQDR